MDIREMQRRVKEASLAYGAQYGIDVVGDWAALKLAEEAGEAMQAYIRMTGRSRRGKLDPKKSRHAFGRELADLVGFAMILAHDNAIDLGAMMAESWDLEGARPAEERS